jgi:hypothetical protein
MGGLMRKNSQYKKMQKIGGKKGEEAIKIHQEIHRVGFGVCIDDNQHWHGLVPRGRCWY